MMTIDDEGEVVLPMMTSSQKLKIFQVNSNKLNSIDIDGGSVWYCHYQKHKTIKFFSTKAKLTQQILKC